MWMYTLLPKVINMSLTAAIVIVFVFLARIPLKKAPKIFSYALWAVVLFRLVCPVSFSSDFSLMGLLKTPAATNGTIAYIPADIVHVEYPQVDLPVPGLSEVINESLPQGEEQLAADPLEAPMAAATMLWLCGIVVMLVYSAVSLVQLRRKLVGAVRLQRAVGNFPVGNGVSNGGDNGANIAVNSGTSNEGGNGANGVGGSANGGANGSAGRCVKHENIYLADHISTPFVIGLIHPKIYLPSTLTEQEMSYVILHEQTHIRRFDHIVKMIAFLALAVHWFNPLVWVAFLACVKDMEMSCDERVLKDMGAGIKTNYSASLLSLATGRRLINGSPLAFGEGNIKGRIKNVLNYRKPAFWIILAAVIAVATIYFCLTANPAGITMNGKEVDLSDIEEMNIGAEMPRLLYGDKNRLVIQGTFGLLVYDIDDSLVTDRLSYKDVSPLGISMLYAAVSQDGSKIFIGNDEPPGSSGASRYTHQYDVRTGTITKISRQPGNLYRLVVISPSPGYNEQYDKYFDFNYLNGDTIIDYGDSFLYLRANTDWSMKSLQCVICQYKDGTSESQNIFTISASGVAPDVTPGVASDDEQPGNAAGEGGHLFEQDTGRTLPEPTPPDLSPELNLGADMTELDYASDDIVIFHGYYGLFVYDLNSRKIVRSIDLKPIGCSATQGDDYCDVTVSTDGKTVQLHPMSSKNMYVYSVPDNTLVETDFERMENRFAEFIDTVDIVGLERMGLHSHSTVKFESGGYGYLRASDWKLGTLTYVRDDKVYKLFDFDVLSLGDASPLPENDLEHGITNDIEQSLSNPAVIVLEKDNKGNGSTAN